KESTLPLANNKLKSVYRMDIGSGDWVEDLVSFELTSDEADADAQTFAEYNAGANREWVLNITAVWDGGSDGSLHGYLWDNAGSTVTFEIQPVSGVISAQRPAYSGQVRIPFKPDISVEAGSDSTFEYEFEVVG